MSKQNQSSKGNGFIRKVTKTVNGKAYTFWEGCITIGSDPGTGKQKRISFNGKTQQEVREKMASAVVEVDTGTYIEPINN